MSPLRGSCPLTLARRSAAAFISGFVIALVTHLATVFVFFVANGAAAANVVPISNYFLLTTLVLFLLAAAASLAGALRSWPIALPVGAVLGALAAIVGTMYGAVNAGGDLSADTLGLVLASLLGTNLVLIAAAAVVTATVGRWVWSLILSVGHAPVAIVRQPSARLAEGELSHRERVPVDSALAGEQWAGYVELLQSAGFDTVEVPGGDELPDSVFVEDWLVVLGGVGILTRPGAQSRREEPEAVRPIARRLGLRLRELTEPATLDGGDVLVVGSTVYVGRSARTNAEGVRQLREIASPLGYRVVAVPVTSVLHLKSAVTALPDGTVIGYPEHVDSPALFERFLAMPEPGAAVVVLSPDTVLMASSTPKSIALIEDLGYRVIEVDVSEFEKLEGGVTCLSVRLS